MTKKSKSINPSTLKEKRPVKVLDEYYDFLTFRKKPMTETNLDMIAERLVIWANKKEKRLKDEALTMTEFFADIGIALKDAAKWRQRYEPFNEAYLFALRRIGARREKGAVLKEFDSAIVRSCMPQYEEKEMSWTEMEEWRAKLSAKESDKMHGATKVVVIENYTEGKNDE